MCHNAVCTLAVVATSPLLHRIHTFACISIFTQRLHVIFALLLLLLYQNFALLICTARSCFLCCCCFFCFCCTPYESGALECIPICPKMQCKYLHTHIHTCILMPSRCIVISLGCVHVCVCAYIYKYLNIIARRKFDGKLLDSCIRNRSVRTIIIGTPAATQMLLWQQQHATKYAKTNANTIVTEQKLANH